MKNVIGDQLFDFDTEFEAYKEAEDKGLLKNYGSVDDHSNQ